MKNVLADFQKYGRILFEQGLNNSHSGNMSVRDSNRIHITGHGAKLCALEKKDIVTVNLADTKKDAPASVEVGVHRAIYQHCPGVNAVVHAHTPYGIVLSLKQKSVKPIDSEGKYYFSDIPVLSCKETIASSSVAKLLPHLIAKNKAAIIAGHGAFGGGKTLEEATMYVSVLESICRLVYLAR